MDVSFYVVDGSLGSIRPEVCRVGSKLLDSFIKITDNRVRYMDPPEFYLSVLLLREAARWLY